MKYPDSGKKSDEKQAESPNEILEKGCLEALQQIEKIGDEEKLRQDGLETILKHGIACNRKNAEFRPFSGGRRRKSSRIRTEMTE